MDSGIDFIVLWVDGNDLEWQEKKKRYSPAGTSDNSAARYRDWDNLKYWFRGVAKFAPWVRTVHFVTDDQVPEWLNVQAPRLHLVSHRDYMPEQALPVFNSNAIEVGMHRIEGLAEHFVYFNDDLFLVAPIKPGYYFTDGLPVDMAGLTRAGTPSAANVFARIQQNNYRVINARYSKAEVLKKHGGKWLKPSYGKTFVRTLLNLGRKDLSGLVIPHLSVPYRKQDWERVWAYCGEQLRDTQFHRFRDAGDLTHFLFRFWRMCEGDFSARRSLGRYYSLTEKELPRIVTAIKKQTYPEVCLNDCWTNGDFEGAKETLNAAFETILPEKCEFER